VIEVVGVLIAAGDCQHTGAQNVGDAVRDEQPIARVGNQRREPLGDPETTLGGREQHHAAVRREASAIKSSNELLASNGWKAERLNRIVGHGGCGSA